MHLPVCFKRNQEVPFSKTILAFCPIIVKFNLRLYNKLSFEIDLLLFHHHPHFIRIVGKRICRLAHIMH